MTIFFDFCELINLISFTVLGILSTSLIGTLAEYAIAAASHAISLPDGLSYDQAARKFYFTL